MADFEPFDEEYKIDKEVLSEDFPNYMADSLISWIFKAFQLRSYIKSLDRLSPSFTLPFNRRLRTQLSTDWSDLKIKLRNDSKFTRNFISYILQFVVTEREAKELEKILSESSSAYTVETNKVNIQSTDEIGISLSTVQMKLVYRVAPIVKKQSEVVMSNEKLLAEAWEFHYGINPDDEKTVTRCTDALAGVLRDRFFPEEKRTQLGKLVGLINRTPDDYDFPAQSIFNKQELLGMMSQFSKIRGNHKTGTGREATHEEAAFVLHYSIMFYRLLKNN